VKSAIDAILGSGDKSAAGGVKLAGKLDLTQFSGVEGEASNGGVVPGPRGSSQIWRVHGGETILPTHKGGGYGGVTVIVQGNTLQSDADMQRLILDAMQTAKSRGALGFA
jgi:hypothetical protein